MNKALNTPLSHSRSTPEGVIITGASAGIGRALAEALAVPGVRLGLLGRDAGRLESVAAVCRQKGAEVDLGQIDVADFDLLNAWVSDFERRGAIKLMIANAGMTAPYGDGQGELLEDRALSRRLLDVNLFGVLNAVYAVEPGMRRQGEGQIVLLSSLAAFRGMALTPAYSASKAAVKAYAEALRDLLAPAGIKVSVVCPGFVETGMSDQFPGPRPQMMSSEQAAERILKGVRRDEACIAFPWSTALGMRLLSVLPFEVGSFFLRLLKLQPPSRGSR